MEEPDWKMSDYCAVVVGFIVTLKKRKSVCTSITNSDDVFVILYRKGIRFRTLLARMLIALSLLLGFVLSKLDLLLKILFYLYHVSFFW